MKVFTVARLKPGETKITIDKNQLRILDKSYEFDVILDEQTQQDELYVGLNIGQLLEQFKNGISQVIFCYGQTGSGKTYTVNQLIPMILPQILESKFEISFSVLQIYNEKILDMLYKQQLKLRYKNNEFVPENLTKFICRSQEELVKLYNKANKNRIINSHQLNDFSSRSHCIYTFHGQTTDLQCEFNIVDLAGSERLNQTKVQQIQESVEINKSLFYLRQVIQNLADKVQQIPYRQSKLTSLLKKSLNGKSNVVMVICLNPSDDNLLQCQQSAQYGVKARQIILQPEQQQDDQQRQIRELKQQIINLEQQLKIAQNTIKSLKQNQQNQQVQQQQNNIQMEQINQINNLLGQNKKLRDQMQHINDQNFVLSQLNHQMQNENQDLRDKINIFEEIISEDLKKNKDPFKKDWVELFQGEGSNYLEIIINKLQYYKQWQAKYNNEKILLNPIHQTVKNGRNQRSFSIGKREFKF
ncbi:unnamed protein product [Paramecium octaurelia]|uniref:Kinesin motor domain-containing protein n=1 Tax=Paramecium octaurelia TaxID=43137 RepID=A0A8S1XAN4_PAROT|nr:unnamed protein product [Paramecium octaurelia]